MAQAFARRAGQPDQADDVSGALAHVVSATGRVVEDRLDLWKLELRDELARRSRIWLLRAASLVAIACALGLGTAAVIWGLSMVLPLGLSLGLVALGFGGAAVGLGVATRRLERANEPPALAPAAGQAALAEHQGGTRGAP